MLLQRVLERNPQLIDASIQLQQEGKIPANTWVYDLDAIAENARLQAERARELGLTTYVMTKQYARNPMVTMVALSQGLYKTVAVDIHGAKMMHRYGIPVGHIGHLNQIPKHDVGKALDMRPDVITVFSVEAARRISEVATQKGRSQDLLVRVYAPGDVFFAGQEGGFREEEVLDAVRQIQTLPGVQVVGVTSFPCLFYNFDDPTMPVRPNPNLATITRAAARLQQELGIEIKQINAPGNTSIETFPVLKEAGATHVEPGHGLLGTTPTQIQRGTAPEKPTYVYVTEISHHFDGLAYAFAGGLWSIQAHFLAPTWKVPALVGADATSARQNEVEFVHVDQIIDYHVPLTPGDRCHIGDTVVLPMYTQAQMTRSHTAAVSGMSEGKPVVWGIFDHAATMLDEEYEPVPVQQAKEKIHALLERYPLPLART